MTERRGDPGFSVTPRRIGGPPGSPGRRRIPRLGVAIVALAGVAILAIAAFGPRLSGKPSFDVSFFATPTPDPSASRSPSPSPTPTSFVSDFATPLPAVTRPVGATVSGTVAFQTDSFHVLDLATGAITGGPPTIIGSDALFRSATGGGWTCICFTDDEDNGIRSRHALLTTMGPDGSLADQLELVRLTLTMPQDGRSSDLTTDVDMFDGGHRGLLAISRNSGGQWDVSLAGIDVDRQSLAWVVPLDAGSATPIPSQTATPAPGSESPDGGPNGDRFVDGPHVRVAPGGRWAFVWGVLHSFDNDGPTTEETRAWRVELDENGAIGDIAAAPGFDALPTFCTGMGFGATDRLVWVCPQVDPDGSVSDPQWVLGTIGPDGRAAGRLVLAAPAGGYFTEPLFDRANGLLYLWDPTGLKMSRIDVHSLALEAVTYDPAARSAAGIVAAGGQTEPVWEDADSAIQQNGFGQLVGSPDGTRMYGIGFDQQDVQGNAPASRGVFVIDRSTLALLGRWAPAAYYLSVSVTSAGPVVAAGLPNVDEHGKEAPWQGSLTAYDPADGRILVRFGQLGYDNPPLVIDH